MLLVVLASLVVLDRRPGRVATALLSDLVERGLDPEQGILFVIDGAKALRKAIRTVFGDAAVQRCVWHKERNVTDLLPERDRPVIRARMRAAWALSDPELARQRLQLLASELERSWPDAAACISLVTRSTGLSGTPMTSFSSFGEIVSRHGRCSTSWPDELGRSGCR